MLAARLRAACWRSGRLGATTVAGTIRIAAALGIRVMATGGIGGVHRGGETSLDVSADLLELARSGVAVVCSGAKIILDLPRTLEVLETLGVPVVGFGTDSFPAFYARESGLPRAAGRPTGRARGTVAGAGRARLALRARDRQPAAGRAAPCRWPSSSAGSRTALADGARGAGSAGRAETPALLAALAERSGGRTVALNEALVIANARLAGRLARASALDATIN